MCHVFVIGMKDVSSAIESSDYLDKSELEGSSLPLLQGLSRTGALPGSRDMRQV